MTSSNTDALVDEERYPARPIDHQWSVTAETTAIELTRRFHQAIRSNDQAIACADEMWNGLGKDQADYARLHYMYGGRSALKIIVDSLILANAPLPRSIFDFPSAHGRVTRFLKAAFPESEIWAGDLNTAGVDFCATRFGAKPFYSGTDLSKVAMPRKFDLIWCGSLASHLPEDQCKVLFSSLLNALEDNGILCITTCGRGMQWAHEHVFKTIHDEAYERIRSTLESEPFAFAPYHYKYGAYTKEEAYGMAFIRPAWIEQHVLSPEFQVLLYREKAWHGAQDVWCLRRQPLSTWYDWARA
jgi:hypothetical protein